MAVQLGTTVRCNYPPRHIWVVLSDPTQHKGKFVFVNLTSLDESCVDDACILDRNDYDELDHATTVAYSRAMIGGATELENAIAKGLFVTLDPIPASTLKKMIAGAYQSSQLAQKKKALLPPEVER